VKKRVFKAVIPAAGFGTRMLPFTKAVPKELIPLVDKPVLQYVIEEAVAAGIEEVLLIVSSGKEAIIRHFNPVPELEIRLAESGKQELLADIRALNTMVKISYVYQQQLDGLGGAVRLAKNFAGDDPVAVLLGDTVLDSHTDRSVTGQLVDVYERYGTSVIAFEQVPLEKVSRYGVADAEELGDGVLKLRDLVEKPAPENAPSNLAVAARYLFTPGIFTALENTVAGLHNEVQLTDAVRLLLKEEAVHGCRIAGKRFDLGSKAGFIAANVEFAMRCPELQESLEKQLKCILK